MKVRRRRNPNKRLESFVILTWGVQPESKGESQPQKPTGAGRLYASLENGSEHRAKQGGLLSVVNFPQHAVLHLKAATLNSVQASTA